MRFLRTVSTQRLLASIAGAIAVIAVCTAIAVAASGNGPVPKAQRLANAIHSALAAPSVNGITARISFSNRLIDASNLQGSDPILNGAKGRLWISSDHRIRLELQSDNGDAQVVAGNGSFWVYDPSAHTVYQGKLPAQQADKHAGAKEAAKASTIPSVAQIQGKLNQALAHLTLSRAIPGDIANRPTYTVRVSPKHDGGLLGAAELAWDAGHGVPLRVAVFARGNSSPVLELKVTNIHYGRVPTSDFTIAPPSGAKVVKVSNPAGRTAGAAAKFHSKRKSVDITGITAVAHRLTFHLIAPTKLVGLPRQSVQLLDWAGTPAALITYGQNLGGIAVIEQTAKSAKAPSPTTSNDHRGLNLPTVSINGTTGQELDTALGTMVRFTRSGVSYVVVGSVPAAAADAAARAL